MTKVKFDELTRGDLVNIRRGAFHWALIFAAIPVLIDFVASALKSLELLQTMNAVEFFVSRATFSLIWLIVSVPIIIITNNILCIKVAGWKKFGIYSKISLIIMFTLSSSWFIAYTVLSYYRDSFNLHIAMYSAVLSLIGVYFSGLALQYTHVSDELRAMVVDGDRKWQR
jgi:hypothetical protein